MGRGTNSTGAEIFIKDDLLNFMHQQIPLNQLFPISDEIFFIKKSFLGS